MLYRHKSTGETMDQDLYLAHQIDRYLTELTEKEQVEWQSLYGKAAVKVWSAQNPDQSFERVGETDPAPSAPIELASVRSVPEKQVLEDSATPPKRSSLPPRRDEKRVVDAKNETEKVSSLPPKRKNTLVTEAETISRIPPKRTTAIPPKRSSTATTIPPRRPEREPMRVRSTTEPVQTAPYTREELWRMAKEDPYYDETPTEDDGVYNRFAKMELKQILLVIGLLIFSFIMLFIIISVLFS